MEELNTDRIKDITRTYNESMNQVTIEEEDEDAYSDQILETKPDPHTPQSQSADNDKPNKRNLRSSLGMNNVRDSNGANKKKKHVATSNKYIVQLYYPELAFIVFKVKNARNWYTCKMGGFRADSVRPGLRSVELFDRQLATDGFSSLLLHIQILQ